jgi:hypothetical protein
LLPFRKLAVFTTDMSGAPLERGANFYSVRGVPILAAQRDQSSFLSPITAGHFSCFTIVPEETRPEHLILRPTRRTLPVADGICGRHILPALAHLDQSDALSFDILESAWA